MPNVSSTITDDVISYLAEQRFGRLATVDAKNAPQNNPVGFRYNPEIGTIDIGGHNLTASRKFRNIGKNPAVAFVVDDLVSVRPWHVRCVEIRGRAEALESPSELIRIYPERVISFGLAGPPQFG
jgi:pyridoxamine 5'-phosphate oxidase family protein